MQVDYTSLLMDEFIKSIKNSKVSTDIASARFWSLILQVIYSQVGIQVPKNVETAQFSNINIPKAALDDLVEFAIVDKASVG